MNKFMTALVVIVVTMTVHSYRDNTPPSDNTASASSAASEQLVDSNVNQEPAIDPKSQQTPPEQAVEQPAETCRSAIAKVWPVELQAGAVTVMTYENRQERPDAVGAVNPDAVGSRDYGCFQINNYWHPRYFSDGDWRDPLWAAKYALQIYRERQSANGNGWSAWYAVHGVLW